MSQLARTLVGKGVTGYINAGGRGTRLNPIFTPDERLGVSKALLAIGHSSVVLIEHHINKMLAAGVDTVVVGVGDHKPVADHVERVYGTTGRVYAVLNEQQLGNGGDLLQNVRQHPQYFARHIVIANVDTILDWDESAAFERHDEKGAGLTIALTLNKGVPNEGAFYVDDKAKVIYSAEATANRMHPDDAKQAAEYRGSSTGSVIISMDLLDGIAWDPADGPCSLYKDVVAAALEMDGLYAYSNGDRFFIDVGTVATWTKVTDDPAIIEPYLYY